MLTFLLNLIINNSRFKFKQKYQTNQHFILIKLEYQSCVSNCADTNGECVEEDTELVCYCPEGYVANDIYECEDVNECDDNPCVAEATCMNSIGSFQCICPPTTFGDGINACAGINKI